MLPKLSWVGFDIKAPLADYEKITGIANSGNQAFESLELLLGSGVDYEVRTTVDPTLLNQDDILNLATNLSQIGVKHYVLQQCRPNQADITHHTNSVDLNSNGEIATQLGGIFDTFSIRTF